MSRFNALRELFKFSLPIILGQIGMMLIGTGDMLIAGRYSRESLAAIGLAISIANPIQISALGFQFSISPLLAQKRGQGEKIESYLGTVVIYSLLIGFVASVLTYFSYLIVPLFGYDESLNLLIKDYLMISSFSSVGLCLYVGIKEYFQSVEKTFAANFIAIFSAVVNVGLNYVLVFGTLQHWGIPHFKENGLAVASLVIRFLMGLSLFLVTKKWWHSLRSFRWSFLKEMFQVGFPIASSLFFEILAFCSVTLFVGKFEEIQTAANNLALNLGSLAFMIPLSISAAVSVKVGHAFGEKNKKSISIYSQVSLFASILFTMMMGLIFYFFPRTILSFYTDDGLVLDWAQKLLFWVACFQLFDGAQVTLSGILRGLSITRPAFIAIFIGYWIVGLPLGYYLAFSKGFEAQGFWIGLAISLSCVAIMLSFVFSHKFKTIE